MKWARPVVEVVALGLLLGANAGSGGAPGNAPKPLQDKKAGTPAWSDEPGQAVCLDPSQMESRLVVPVTKVEHFRFPVIDVHSHVYEKTPAGIAAWVKTMDRVGLRTTFILSGQTGAALRETLEHYARAYPGRFVVLAGFDHQNVEAADYAERLRRQLDEDLRAGAVGLGELLDKGTGMVRENGRVYFIDEPRFDPLWEEAGRRGVPVFVHIAEPAAFYAPLDVHNELERSVRWSLYGKGTPGFDAMLEKFGRVLARHPHTRFIAVHAFNLANNLGAVGQLLDQHPNVQIDFAARMWELARQPFTARRFLIKYQDRVLFGTDNGDAEEMYLAHAREFETEDEWFWPPDRDWWRGYGLNLPDAALRKIYSENARRLLPELRAVAGMANETHRLASGYQAEIDDQLKTP